MGCQVICEGDLDASGALIRWSKYSAMMMQIWSGMKPLCCRDNAARGNEKQSRGERCASDASRNDWRLAAEKAEDSRYHSAQLRILGPPQGHSLGCLLIDGPELFATQGKLRRAS